VQTAPRPTRAEATDIANCVLDGADGFVLCAQTVRGSQPRATVATVAGICREAERVFDRASHFDRVMALADVRLLLPPRNTLWLTCTTWTLYWKASYWVV
jgi:pyruvate kinase